MDAHETREIRTVVYLRDSYGWIWRQVTNAKEGEAHWVKTGATSFEQVEATR